MPKVISIREENIQEKNLREWFETQLLESPKNLEELSLPSIKMFGVGAVGLWLAALLCSLVVVTPRKWQSDAGKPDTQSQVFRQLLNYKATWLRLSAILFGLAVIALGVVLVAALLSV